MIDQLPLIFFIWVGGQQMLVSVDIKKLSKLPLVIKENRTFHSQLEAICYQINANRNIQISIFM